MIDSLAHPLLALGAPGPMEIALIVLLVLILFGAKRLPDLARGLGKGIREFRSALSDTSDQIKKDLEHTPEKKSGDNNTSETKSNG